MHPVKKGEITPGSAGAAARNEALRASKHLGRALWRPLSAASFGMRLPGNGWSGYHRRSRVETNPFGLMLRINQPGSGCIA